MYIQFANYKISNLCHFALQGQPKHLCEAVLKVSLAIYGFMYHILLVNSYGYYKFQVEMSAETNQDFYIKIAHKHIHLWFNLELHDNYLSLATI